MKKKRIIIIKVLYNVIVQNEFGYPHAVIGIKVDICIYFFTLPPTCAVVMKSGNLNFLEPPGPLQACNGTALLYMYLFSVNKRIFLS